MTPPAWLPWPAAAAILLLCPALWILLWARDRARARSLAVAVGARAPVLSDLDPGRRRIARGLASAATLCALAAILQPRFGEPRGEVAPRGADVVVALDVSRSMLARDVTPSRLLAARERIRTLAARARGDRLALVVFSGEAHLAAPLTRDLDSLVALVALADPLSVDTGGTDLGAALRAGLEALEGASGDHGAIVLLTDGEDLGRQGVHVASECRRRGIPVHAVGMGSGDGSKIPVETDQGEGFLRDRSGREVVSTLNESALRRIAETTGGDYADGGSPDALVELYERRILPRARHSFEDRESSSRPNRFQWPLILAIGIWLWDLAGTHRRRT